MTFDRRGVGLEVNFHIADTGSFLPTATGTHHYILHRNGDPVEVGDEVQQLLQ